MKRRNWRKLAICSWQLGSKDFVSRAFCPDFMACQGLKTVSMITWLLNDSILSMQKDARRFHHVWICIDVRFTTKAQIFHWWNSESVKGQGSIFGETCRVTEIRKIQQNDHHSISILSSYISNPFTMCFRFLPKLFTSLRFKGAAEPRAIGPIHRADQRTDAGTPSADQAGQNIAWSILRHLLGFPSRLPIQETAEGGTTESPLRHLPSVPWKNASRKHMEWGHSTWIWLYGQQAQPLLSGIRPCVSKLYETVVFPVTETDFVPTIAGSRHSTLAICGPGLNGIQTFLLISLLVSHSYTRMKVSFFRYLSCRSSRPHILCLIATILPLSQIEIFTLHIWLERISSFTNLNKLSCEVRHIRWGRIGHRRDSESASRLAG